ncbi:MAG: peroxiredoxin family protein, partial [bacterium]
MRRPNQIEIIRCAPVLVAISLLAGPAPGPLKVGDKAPLFSLPTLEGKTLNLKDELGLRPILLTFFTAAGPAGWVQNKDLRAAVDVEGTYPSFIRVIAIAVGNAKSEFDQLRYPGIVDTTLLLAPDYSDPALKAYRITETPASFLIDEKGTLLAVYLKAKQLQPTVADLLETRWQDQAYLFSDYGTPPDIPLDGSSVRNVNAAPAKPTLFLFWAAASYPSEQSLAALDTVVALNPEFDFVTSTFSPPALVQATLKKTPLKRLTVAKYSPTANADLLSGGKAFFPYWLVVNPK